MVGREVERREIVEIGLDLGSERDLKTHLGEDGEHLALHEAQWMHSAGFGASAGEGEIHEGPSEITVARFGAETQQVVLQERLDAILRRIDGLTEAGPLCGGNLAHACHEGGNGASLAEEASLGVEQHLFGLCGSKNGIRLFDDRLEHLGGGEYRSIHGSAACFDRRGGGSLICIGGGYRFNAEAVAARRGT